jgi:prophage DNA circulation protein
MIVKTERAEALAIATRMLAALLSFSLTPTGTAGADLRSAVGRFLANFSELVIDKVVGTELFACFEQARAAGATLYSMNTVREAMFLEQPAFQLGFDMMNAGIIFSFVEQSEIISRMEFKSRSQVSVLLDEVSVVIEAIKLNKADEFIPNDYQNFVSLAALLVQHMSATERQLPRIIQLQMPVHYTSLSLSNRIYGEGGRSEELAAENKTVHPAFMQRDIIALAV